MLKKTKKADIFLSVKMNFYQKTLFDDPQDDVSCYMEMSVNLTNDDISKFHEYKLEDYIKDIETAGLERTWAYICEYVLTNDANAEFLNVQNFGEMYEIGLAIQDKQQKKDNGQYYTPNDVALVMSEWLDSLDGENVCDVACGTGKLILTYFDFIGYERALKLLDSGKLFLYDRDFVALRVCKTAILLKYGKDLKDKIHVIAGDFLSSKIALPKNCKVISNPPYASIQQVGYDWNNTKVLHDSRELYAVFMEKIIKESVAAVVIMLS